MQVRRLHFTAICHYTAEMNSERHFSFTYNGGCKWHFRAACSLQLINVIYIDYYSSELPSPPSPSVDGEELSIQITVVPSAPSFHLLAALVGNKVSWIPLLANVNVRVLALEPALQSQSTVHGGLVSSLAYTSVASIVRLERLVQSQNIVWQHPATKVFAGSTAVVRDVQPRNIPSQHLVANVVAGSSGAVVRDVHSKNIASQQCSVKVLAGSS